jgi:hypothetical protein
MYKKITQTVYSRVSGSSIFYDLSLLFFYSLATVQIVVVYLRINIYLRGIIVNLPMLYANSKHLSKKKKIIIEIERKT